MQPGRVRIPANGWRPRDHQLNLWGYLEHGGKRAMAVWHRRSGKDEVALQHTCVSMHKRIGNYWHMLPEARQARKAIWDAINPHTGKRRIDEAFPLELRRRTVDNEMKIEMLCGSIWQAVGSDNYNSLVGTPPIGVVGSEWALADPMAWAYLRPILAENGGWGLFITTPRGRNHAHRLAELAKKEDGWFFEQLDVDDTGIFTREQLAAERRELVSEWGEEDGEAFFQQEYYCSFDAALVGSYYGAIIARLEKAGHVRKVPHDPSLPVFTAWDLGYHDDCVIWFYQVVRGEIRVIDYYATNNVGVDKMAEALCGRRIVITARDLETGAVTRFTYAEPLEPHKHRIAYRYGCHWLPHDARPKTFAANGRSTVDQLEEFKVGELRIVPQLSVQDGVQAVRKTLPICYFDEERTAPGLDCLRQHRRKRNEENRVWSDHPVEDWTIHAADGFRMLAVAWFAHAQQTKLPPREAYERAVALAQKPLTFDDVHRMQRTEQRRERV